MTVDYLTKLGHYHEMSVRKHPGDRPVLAARLMLELKECADMYGVTHEISEPMLKECVTLFFSKFNHLSVEEVKPAYREWAATIDLPQGELYSGLFTMRHFGVVLAKYDTVRARVLPIYLRERDAAEQRQKEEARAKAFQESFDRNFPDILKRARLNMEDWRRVPEFWYGVCERFDMLNLDILTKEERHEIMDRATQLALHEVQQEQPTNLFAMPEPETLELRAKTIARKIAVWEKVMRRSRVEVPKKNQVPVVEDVKAIA